MPTDDLTRAWTARLHDIATETNVVGAALGLWVDGQEVRAAHGVLNTATQVEVTPDALFQIGSITKVWTATMVMQLVEEGRLTLDTTIAEVLPGVRLCTEDSSHEVQVRHLLTHTSGIDGDIFTDTGRGDDCVERYVDLLAAASRTHALGAAYSYCNSGFAVLGRMVEVLDGRSWDASLRARLIGPLRLTETVTLPEEAILHRAAVGHRDHPHESDPVSVWQLPRSIGPVGLITASVHDVLAFARVHVDGGVTPDGKRLLSSESVEAMQQPQFEIPGIDKGRDAIGLAWRLNRWGDRRIIGHDGGTIGQLAYLRVDPDARVAACLLTNSSVSESLYERLFTEIFEEYVGAAPPAVPTPRPEVVAHDPARHVGRYERTSRRYDVTLRGQMLHVLSELTGDRTELSDEWSAEFDLHPVDVEGSAFVFREFEAEPWSVLLFDHFPDGTPYLYSGGRATPRARD